ncbi:hypothetical protein BC939DRAFT_513194 [Gamsiella multidivaricata]|uniref:uncharacterized protein n=1 Tax=Gamsiella multidivaricata TaxID=101098 RepID=UPI00222014A0|nr:uncharacterized protein BC939DRAFT_513194 [Gamsiella multidivaricata]KAI7815786.1 hypothetical protein BC939DRAFT_513194 [Gamsiella multidivaricata]
MITPLPTVSEIAEDASVDPTQESAVESPSSDGDRSLPLRNKAVPVLTSTEYDDDDAGDMDVDEDCIPSRLPSFKKRTAINADESVPGYDASIDESLTEEDTDNESELEMARSTLENMRLNLKRMDKNILRLQSRAARDCGIPNAQLTQELSDFKMQRSITFGSYGELKQAYENLAESMTPLKPRIVAKESTVYEASDDYQSLPIRRNQKSFIGGLPIKLQSNWPRYNGKADETAYEFFDKFIRQVRPILGEEIFRQYGHTYLSLLVSDNNFQDQLQTAFDKLSRIAP